jgi:hypothetical protein
MARGKAEKQNGGGNLGFEQTLWAAADKLRGHMDATVHSQVEANPERSHTLATLRDALLPKLLSGEVRVKAGQYGEQEGAATAASALT